MNKRISLYVLFSLAIFLAATPIAWSAPCGDTAGTGGTDVPCNCGDTVVTDTRLTAADPVTSVDEADVCSPGDALIFQPPTTDKMTLNLNNLQLRGSFGGVGVRIVGTGVRVFVINGRIKGFDTAIATDPGTQSTTQGAVIQGIVAINNTNGIELEGDSGLINSSQVIFNTGTGIQLRGTDHEVEFTQISHNGGDGIVVTGNGSQLHQLNLNKNGGTGVTVKGDNNLVDHVLSENNTLDGIQIVGNGDGNDNTLELWKNKTVKNGRHGISVTGNNHDFLGNQANSNGGSGITVTGSGNDFKSNKGNTNKEDGIFVSGGGNFDEGGNLGKKNGDVQCEINGLPCSI